MTHLKISSSETNPPANDILDSQPKTDRPSWDSFSVPVKKPAAAPKKTMPAEKPRIEFTCDLSTIQMFPSNFGTSIPFAVTLAYATAPIHRYFINSRNWDYHLILLDKKTAIIRSDCHSGKGGVLWRDLLIAEKNNVFLHIEDGDLWAYAPDRETARNIATNFYDKYSIPEKSDLGCYNLITVHSSDGIDTESVPLQDRNQIDEAKMDLYYGAGFAQKSAFLLEFLRTERSGLSIFEGSPGTGKTSYIRYLMGVLKDTHRFYFIPPASTGVLTNPEFIRFWSRQSAYHKKYRFVCVLEDADGVLMTRDLDNRREVGAILNITDGLLADFLKLQVICSINCSSTEIDPALIRPGRLSAHLLFDRMTACRAQRIAADIGRDLPHQNDYSLAEIFNTPATALLNKPRIGFAA